MAWPNLHVFAISLSGSKDRVEGNAETRDKMGETGATEMHLDSFRGTVWEVLTTFPAPWVGEEVRGGVRTGNSP